MFSPALKWFVPSLIVALSLSLIPSFSRSAHSQSILYVNATSGADNASCGALTSPCRTIAHAVSSRASAGDTVQVAAGTYADAVTISRPLTIRGPNAGVAGSDIRGAEALINRRWTLASGGVTIDGLRFSGAIPAGGTGVIQASGGLSALADVTIRNSVFVSLNRSALHVSLSGDRSTNTRWRIERNLVSDLSGPDRAGFTLWGLGSVTVRDNVVRRTTASAIQVDGVFDSLIEHNTISETPAQALNLAGALRNVSVRENSISRANTGAAADRAAIRLLSDTYLGPVWVLNNSIEHSTGAVVVAGNFTHRHIVIRNNHFAATSGSSRREGAGGSVDMRCNAWGDRSGPAWSGNPDGTGIPLTIPADGDTLAAPWLNEASDTDTTKPGVQQPGSVLVTAPGTLNEAVNDYRVLANAIGCAEAGQVIVLRGSFDWSSTQAQGSWRLGVDQRAGTADDGTILLPEVTGATLRAETPGDGTLRGSVAETASSALRFAGAGSWHVSGLRFLALTTAVVVDPAANGSLLIEEVAMASDVSVGLDSQAPLASVQATCVFWGTANGPRHPNNPGGSGAAVLGNPIFTPFARAPFACSPTPVTLIAFSATRGQTGVTLTWTSASEIGISGYRLLRSTTPEREQAGPVGPSLIVAQGDGLVETSYSISDHSAPSTAYYWLETVEPVPQQYGPILSTQILLPLLSQ